MGTPEQATARRVTKGLAVNVLFAVLAAAALVAAAGMFDAAPSPEPAQPPIGVLASPSAGWLVFVVGVFVSSMLAAVSRMTRLRQRRTHPQRKPTFVLRSVSWVVFVGSSLAAAVMAAPLVVAGVVVATLAVATVVTWLVVDSKRSHEHGDAAQEVLIDSADSLWEFLVDHDPGQVSLPGGFAPTTVVELWAHSLALAECNPAELNQRLAAGGTGQVSPRMVFWLVCTLEELVFVLAYHRDFYRFMLDDSPQGSMVGRATELERQFADRFGLTPFSIVDCERRLAELLPFFASMCEKTMDADLYVADLVNATSSKIARLSAGLTSTEMMFDRVVLWAALEGLSRRAANQSGQELFAGDRLFGAWYGDAVSEVAAGRTALVEEDLSALFGLTDADDIARLVDDSYNANRLISGSAPDRAHWYWPNWTSPPDQAVYPPER